MTNVDQPSETSTTNKCEVSEDRDFRYERMDKLGEGTYGIVYRSRDKETNEVFHYILKVSLFRL